MTEDERSKLYRMEEKIDGVDKRVERLEGKFDTFLNTQEERHYQLMTHSSSEAAKIAGEFAGQMKEMDIKKADKWTEKVWSWLMGIIGTAVVGAVIYAIVHSYAAKDVLIK